MRVVKSEAGANHQRESFQLKVPLSWNFELRELSPRCDNEEFIHHENRRIFIEVSRALHPSKFQFNGIFDSCELPLILALEIVPSSTSSR